MSEQRDRAATLARKYWRHTFGCPELLELVIDLMVAFADQEHWREFEAQHNMEIKP